MWREKSSTTALPTVCPARLVPAPRGRTATPNCRATSTAATTSSASRGNATPTGSMAYRLASVEYRWRAYASKRTSPDSAARSAASHPLASGDMEAGSRIGVTALPIAGGAGP